MEWWIWFACRFQDHFEFIIKKHETIADDPPLQIYTNEIKSSIVFKRKTGRKLELSSPKTMKLLGSTKKKMLIKIKMGEDVPNLESVEVVLVNYNLVINNYQQASKILFTFLPNQQFGQSSTFAPHLSAMQITLLKIQNLLIIKQVLQENLMRKVLIQRKKLTLLCH